jgi:hypothetical protein
MTGPGPSTVTFICESDWETPRLLLHYHWFSDVLFSLLFAPWLYYLVKTLIGVRADERTP